jgi:regulatory protein
MSLERLSPQQPGGEPTPPPDTSPRRSPRQKTPTEAWGVSAERASRGQRESRESKRQQQLEEDPTGYARQVCLDLLAAAPRTRQELAKALAKRGVPAEAAEHVLERFEDVGMVDDVLFASLWVSSRHRGKGLAGRALSQELRRKGVDDEIVREAVTSLDPEQEEQTARALVRRRLPATRALAAEARIRRVAGMLARKGYAPGLAFRIVKEELAAEGSDTPALGEGARALDVTAGRSPPR